MSPKKQYKLLKESKRLSWEDRLLHKNFKVRYDANIDLKFLCDSVTHPKDPRISELGHLFKKTVSDSDAVIRDKALDALIAYLKAADADVAGRYAKEVCDAITAKCLTGPPKTVEKAQMVFMLWLELKAVDAFQDAMEKAIKSQEAKAVVHAIDITIQALSEFGASLVPTDRIANMLREILDHQDQNVLASSKGLALELCRWFGMEPIVWSFYPKMSDKMKQELDVELPTVKMDFHAARTIRSELQGPLGLSSNGHSEEPASETPLGKDDILTPLKKSGFWNKVKSIRWTQRKEAAAKLTELASTKRIAPGDLTDLCPTLKKLITDRSISVRVEAVRAIGNLALELRVHFSRCSLILLPVLLAKFSEKNPIMTEALTNTLEAIHKAGCLTLANIRTDVNTAVKSEDPHVRSRTLNWVMYCINSSNKAVILNVHEDYDRICLECLNDGTAQVKDAAFSVLAAIEKSVGTWPLNMSLERLDDIRHTKLSERIGVSGGSTPTVVRHGIMKQGLKRVRIPETKIARGMKAHGPCQNKLVKRLQKMSLSDLHELNKKNVDDADEINQLQNMSLSYPQEQNTKDIDGDNGYNKFQESVPAWFADDYFERLSSEELLAQVLPHQKWVKAHTCTRCGILYDDCSCKQQARLENTDDPHRFDHLHEDFTFYVPTHVL